MVFLTFLRGKDFLDYFGRWSFKFFAAWQILSFAKYLKISWVICWRSKYELIRDVLIWTPSHGRECVGRPARTCLQQLCEDKGCSVEYLPEAMDCRDEWREKERERERESQGKFVPTAPQDNDNIYIYVDYIPRYYVWAPKTSILKLCLPRHEWNVNFLVNITLVIQCTYSSDFSISRSTFETPILV